MNGIFPYPPAISTLPNGLSLITVPMPSTGLASFWSIVRTGSRDEVEPGRSGFAHFFEHMTFRGTERFPAEAYQQTLTSLGADANAYTTDDLTAFQLAISAEDLARVMELESDRFMNLSYSETDFGTEAGAVYGEYRKIKTDPLFVIHEAVRERAFERHTYGHTTMGYEADIAAMPTMYDFSRDFFARYYRPENTTLLVVGDVDPDRVHALAERHYAGWERGYLEPTVEDEPEQRTERRFDVGYDGHTLPVLWLAYKIGRFDPADRVRVAADLLVELAYGETSAVYKRLVIEAQSVELLSAHANMNRDPSLLDVCCRIKDPARIEDVERALDDTAASFRDELVDSGRLEALKSRLKYGFLMDLETPDAVAESLARPIALARDLSGLEALYAAYARVTAEDVRAAARQILAPARRTVGLLRGRQ